jgi:hypothetical protein
MYVSCCEGEATSFKFRTIAEESPLKPRGQTWFRSSSRRFSASTPMVGVIIPNALRGPAAVAAVAAAAAAVAASVAGPLVTLSRGPVAAAATAATGGARSCGGSCSGLCAGM